MSSEILRKFREANHKKAEKRQKSKAKVSRPKMHALTAAVILESLRNGKSVSIPWIAMTCLGGIYTTELGARHAASDALMGGKKGLGLHVDEHGHIAPCRENISLLLGTDDDIADKYAVEAGWASADEAAIWAEANLPSAEDICHAK